MEEKDVFAEQVRSVTLYAFDENNKLQLTISCLLFFVWWLVFVSLSFFLCFSRSVCFVNTDQGEQLGDIDYAMNIAGIDPSQCRLIVWAGLNDERVTLLTCSANTSFSSIL